MKRRGDLILKLSKQKAIAHNNAGPSNLREVWSALEGDDNGDNEPKESLRQQSRADGGDDDVDLPENNRSHGCLPTALGTAFVNWMNALPETCEQVPATATSCENAMSWTELTNVATGGTEDFETQGVLMMKIATTETDKHAEVNACCVESCAAVEHDSIEDNSAVVIDETCEQVPATATSCENAMSWTELTNVATGGTEDFETQGVLMMKIATTETDKHAEVNACCVESCAAVEHDSIEDNSAVVDDASLKPNPTPEKNENSDDFSDEEHDPYAVSDDSFLDPDFHVSSSLSEHEAETTEGTNIKSGVNDRNETENTKNQPPKRETRVNKRALAKVLRNSGREYLTASKKVQKEKSMQPPCNTRCKLRCSTKFTEEDRKKIFTEFWALGSLESQRGFIAQNMTDVLPAQRVVLVGERKREKVRNPNRAYHFMHSGSNTKVCKQFFMGTLSISDRMIKTVKEKISKTTGILGEDLRGKHQSHKNIVEAFRKGIEQHIATIPRIESHYCRSSTSRQYIDGSKSLSDIHRDYVTEKKAEGAPYANYTTYRKIFKTFKLSFFKPKKDQCEDCASFQNSLGEDKENKRESYENHRLEADLQRVEKDQDKLLTPGNVIVAAYDLQKVMQCPEGEISPFYYTSKLAVYNLTICELKEDRKYCYVWYEGEGKRGVNEIGTCVWKYLSALKARAEALNTTFDIIFYTDNCCGQQKNQYMRGLYRYAVEVLPHVNSITHKFLVKGHTQNENDVIHSMIENQKRRILRSGPIFLPSEYVTIIKGSKKNGNPLIVNELWHKDFLNIKGLETGPELKMSEVSIMKLTKNDPNNILFKNCFGEHEFSSVTKRVGRRKTENTGELQSAYSCKFSIDPKKKKGLIALLHKSIIPQCYRGFYEGL